MEKAQMKGPGERERQGRRMAAAGGGGEAAAREADRWVSGQAGSWRAGGPPHRGQRPPPRRRLPNPGPQRRGRGARGAGGGCGRGGGEAGRREAGGGWRARGLPLRPRCHSPARLRRSGHLLRLRRAADTPASQPLGRGRPPLLPEARSEAKSGCPQSSIRCGDAGTRPEDERRRAARALTRVGATAPHRRQHDEPARGDALAGCTRRAERAGGAVLSVRPARVPRGPEDGRRCPGPAPTAAAPAPAASPASGRPPALMYVGWAPARPPG